MMKYSNVLLALTLLLLTGCGVPKEITDKLQNHKRVTVDFPVDYYLLLPDRNLDTWDSHYNAFNKFLTKDIMKTQAWMGYTKDGVDVAMCLNAARTHVQLDTAALITDKKQLIGEWRAVSNRRIVFIDSVVFDERKIYRKHKIVYNEKEADVMLVLTDSKVAMFGTEKGSNQYKKMPAKNYSLESGRFLLGYGLAKGGGGVSFVGIDKEGQLLFNWQAVEERKVQGEYITYQAIMTQMIFRKM